MRGILLALLSISILTAALPPASDASKGGVGEVFIIVPYATIGTCEGCNPLDAGPHTSDDHHFEHPNAGTGCVAPAIVVDNLHDKVAGDCKDDPDNTTVCDASGHCSAKQKVTIQIPNNSCYSELWIKHHSKAPTQGHPSCGANNPHGRTRIVTSTPIEQSATAPCLTSAPSTGPADVLEIFKSCTGGNSDRLASETLQMTCSTCSKAAGVVPVPPEGGVPPQGGF